MTWLAFFTWDNLSHIADTLGIVTALPLLVASAYFWSRARRYRRRLRQLAGVTSERPVAVVVALSGTRIRAAVEAFCASVAQPMQIHEVQRSGCLSQADFPHVLFELQNLKNRLMDDGEGIQLKKLNTRRIKDPGWMGTYRGPLQSPKGVQETCEPCPDPGWAM